MKLSTAIEKGAVYADEEDGVYIHTIGDKIYACPLGTAALGVLRGNAHPIIYSLDVPAFVHDILSDVNLGRLVSHPECEGTWMTLDSAVVDLTDAWNYNRKGIVDWLKSIGE